MTHAYSDDDLVVVLDELTPANAEIVAAYLNAQGVEAFTRDVNTESVLPGMGIHGAKVAVRAGDAERARELVRIVEQVSDEELEALALGSKPDGGSPEEGGDAGAREPTPPDSER